MKTNKTRRTLWLSLLAGLQLLVLIGFAGSYYAIGWLGQEFKVRTVPVDPRDLLYGDYVQLSYEINSLPASLWKEQGGLPDRGDKVYVVLTQDSEGYMKPLSAYSQPPKPAGEIQFVIKGRVEYSWEQEIRVSYGAERYYVPEGTGKELEEKADRLAARMKAAPWGQIRIEALEDMEQAKG